MDAVEARHLLRRTGHGTRPADIAPFLPLSRAQAVDRLLDIGQNPPAATPAFLTADNPSKPMPSWRAVSGLGWWWTDRWATAPRPLEEKLMLFFHDHFAVNRRKVEYGHQLWDLMVAIRSNLLGHWPAMVKAVSLSTAMLQYLDNAESRTGQPNENFARELFELHLLGPGHYTQGDVAESARAWTGHGTDRDNRHYRYNPAHHDGRTKTILGATRNWDGPEVIDHIVGHPSLRLVAARHLAARLWEMFAHPDPPARVIDELAAGFVASGFSIRALVRAVLLRDELYGPASVGALARMPIELVADVCRAVGLGADRIHPEWFVGGMGQTWFEPPSPRGWKPHNTLVSASTAMARADLARRVGWQANKSGRLDAVKDMSPEAAVSWTASTLGLDPLSGRTRAALVDLARREQTWAVPVNVLVAALMSPEMVLA